MSPAPSQPELQVNSPHPGPGRIVCIIPAFNEANHIGQVIRAVVQVKSLDQIIVVDDGSSDATIAEARSAASHDPRLVIVAHDRNRGKGEAILTGIHEAGGCKAVLLLDADLEGFTSDHVSRLIDPVLAGHTDMTLGVFRGGRWNTDFSHWLTPWLTGQRCIRQSLISQLSQAAASGYGVETAWTVAASLNHWRVMLVPLLGVWHPPSEIHRGFIRGALTRVRMYAQIVRAWYLAGGLGSIVPRVAVRARAGLVMAGMIFLVGGGRLGFEFAEVPAPQGTHPFPDLPIDRIHRLLVVAPHPDDEIIAAGGLIQRVLGSGGQVKVVFVTNGDGQRFAPLVVDGHVRSDPQAYVDLGEQRQREALAALRDLEVDSQDVFFLGYPDRGVGEMWDQDWTRDCPYRSAYTAVVRSPYPTTFDPGSTYCGSDLVSDLQTILKVYRPDTILLPHPDDSHPDHRGTSNFARLAIILQNGENPGYQPLVLAYLVHYGQYPQPRGLHLQEDLVPPTSLLQNGATWMELALDPAELAAKSAALRSYRSQERLAKSFLSSFVREDEVYLEMPLLQVAPAGFARVPLTASGTRNLPPVSVPTDDSTLLWLSAGSDLVGWDTARVGNLIMIAAETRGPLVPAVNYTLQLKLPDGQNVDIHGTPEDVALKRYGFGGEINLADWGNPQVIGFTAQTRMDILLDQTSWQFISVQYQWP
ncbi:MAG: PIG-L family deacetylase [Anaerolineales bacterium]